MGESRIPTCRGMPESYLWSGKLRVGNAAGVELSCKADSYKGIRCAGKGVGTMKLESLSDESRCGRCVRWRSKASLMVIGGA